MIENKNVSALELAVNPKDCSLPVRDSRMNEPGGGRAKGKPNCGTS